MELPVLYAHTVQLPALFCDQIMCGKLLLVIRLEARLQPNIGFTLRHVLAVFTRSAITPRKMNRFGWNLEHSWLHCWRMKLADFKHHVTTAGESGKLCFCQVNNAQFHWFPVGQISRNLNTTRRSVCRYENFWTEFWKFYHKRSFFQKHAKTSQRFLTSCDHATITPQWLQITGNLLPK